MEAGCSFPSSNGGQHNCSWHPRLSVRFGHIGCKASLPRQEAGALHRLDEDCPDSRAVPSGGCGLPYSPDHRHGSENSQSSVEEIAFHPLAWAGWCHNAGISLIPRWALVRFQNSRASYANPSSRLLMGIWLRKQVHDSSCCPSHNSGSRLSSMGL
jgi:hypothetical protein